MPNKEYWGGIGFKKGSILTYDNQDLTEVMEDLNEDMLFYDEIKTKFIDALTESTDKYEVVRNRYASQPVPYAEGSKPNPFMSKVDFIQQIPFQEYQEGLNITSRAIQTMSAEQVSAFVNAKLTALESQRYSDFRKAVFTNTVDEILDSMGQYRVRREPFYNGQGLDTLIPVAGYKFKAGDDQHFNGVNTANTITEEEVRTLLIDKVRHHGYKSVEIHVNTYDYHIEELANFVPRQDQVGSSTDVNRGANVGTSDSLYDGHIGWILNAPVIKSDLVPQGYVMAVGMGSTAGMKPLYYRTHPLGLDGLQLVVRNEKFPFENTIMTDGWGFAPANRGGVAVVQLTDTTYNVPSDL